MRSTQGKAQRRAGACSCRRGSARGQWPGSRPCLWLRSCKGSASCARECRGGVRGALARGRAEERRGVQAAVSSGAGNQYRVQGAPSKMQRQCRWVQWSTFRAAGQAAAQRNGQGRAARGAQSLPRGWGSGRRTRACVLAPSCAELVDKRPTNHAGHAGQLRMERGGEGAKDRGRQLPMRRRTGAGVFLLVARTKTGARSSFHIARSGQDGGRVHAWQHRAAPGRL